MLHLVYKQIVMCFMIINMHIALFIFITMLIIDIKHLSALQLIRVNKATVAFWNKNCKQPIKTIMIYKDYSSFV